MKKAKGVYFLRAETLAWFVMRELDAGRYPKCMVVEVMKEMVVNVCFQVGLVQLLVDNREWGFPIGVYGRLLMVYSTLEAMLISMEEFRQDNTKVITIERQILHQI
jgi:hypothetical protein